MESKLWSKLEGLSSALLTMYLIFINRYISVDVLLSATFGVPY